MVESFDESVDCRMKNKGEILIYTLKNTSPSPIFHWAQAAIE